MPHQCTDCGRAFEDGSKEMLSGCPNCGGTTFQFCPDGPDAEASEDPPDPPDPAVDGVARTVGNAATAVKDLVAGGNAPDTDPTGSGPARSGPPAGSGSPSEDDAQATARSETLPPEQLSGTRGAGTVPPEWTAPDPEAGETDTDDNPGSQPTTDAPAQTDGPAGQSTRDDATASVADDATGPGTDDTTASVADDATGPGSDDGRADRPGLAELREELNDQFESIRVIEPGQYELNLMELYDREEYIVALQEDGKYTIQVPDRWTGDGD